MSLNLIRKAPVQAVLDQHRPIEKGKCRWCGGRIEDKTGTSSEATTWHPDCLWEYKILTWPATTREAVRKRDKGICADCGNVSKSIKRMRLVNKGTPCERLDQYEVETWHVDHRVPLHAVAHLPDLQRLEYFKLSNIATLCIDCHNLKTSAEATQRAHFKRLAEKAKPQAERRKKPDTIKRWGKKKRAWPKRPFRRNDVHAIGRPRNVTGKCC